MVAILEGHQRLSEMRENAIYGMFTMDAGSAGVPSR
jgi:hypothetical protein